MVSQQPLTGEWRTPSAEQISSRQKKNGRSGGIRTHDPFTPSKVRYQAALRSDCMRYTHSGDTAQLPCRTAGRMLPNTR